MKKTILVVGAAGGVGLALTTLLLARGYDVIGTVLDKQQEDDVRSRLPSIRDLLRIDLSNADNIAPVLTPVLVHQKIELAASS